MTLKKLAVALWNVRPDVNDTVAGTAWEECVYAVSDWAEKEYPTFNRRSFLVAAGVIVVENGKIIR